MGYGYALKGKGRQVLSTPITLKSIYVIPIYAFVIYVIPVIILQIKYWIKSFW